MARIRTIKPEFWTDDLLGSLSREARLLFIATWNLADDEGLLRWTAPILKGAAFPFDDDLTVKVTQKLMDELTECGVVFAYTGGRSQQALAYVLNFRKHQKINRPSPSRLPPPPLQDSKVRRMYGRRDGLVCHLCLQKLDEEPSREYENDFISSPDHVIPVSLGGTDFPSNIKAAHLTCNKGRRDRTIDEYRAALKTGKTAAQLRYPERFTELLTEFPDDESVTEREQGKGTGMGKGNWDDRTSSLRSDVATPKAKKRVRSQIPEGFPFQADFDWSNDLWLKHGRADLCGAAGDEAAKFRDHHSGKLTMSADWPASWRTWARNAIKFNHGGHNGRRSTAHESFAAGALAAAMEDGG